MTDERLKKQECFTKGKTGGDENVKKKKEGQREVKRRKDEKGERWKESSLGEVQKKTLCIQAEIQC